MFCHIKRSEKVSQLKKNLKIFNSAAIKNLFFCRGRNWSCRISFVPSLHICALESNLGNIVVKVKCNLWTICCRGTRGLKRVSAIMH